MLGSPTTRRVDASSLPELVRRARIRSRLSKVAFAKAARTSRAAVHEYENGLRIPRVDSLVKILEPAGLQLQVALSDTDLAHGAGTPLSAFVASLDPADPQWTWRSLISDFVANEFVPSLGAEREALVTDEPVYTRSRQWDAFVAALTEHLCFHAAIETPPWVFGPERGALEEFWWPVHADLPSMRAAAMGLSPAAFRRRGIAIDGRELPLVLP